MERTSQESSVHFLSWATWLYLVAPCEISRYMGRERVRATSILLWKAKQIATYRAFSLPTARIAIALGDFDSRRSAGLLMSGAWKIRGRSGKD